MLTPAVRKSSLCLAALCLPALAMAQIAITNISTSSSDLADKKVNNVKFERTTVSIDQFWDIAGNIYDANTVAGSAYVRRNATAGNANNSSVWYADSTKTAGQYQATYATDYAELLLGNNILRGSDNTFANGTTASEGNVERLDFVFSAAGMTSTQATAFAIFDRGAAGLHDNVKIAIITGWDAINNVPTAYSGNLVNVTSASYGSANLTTDFNYDLFRYSNGNNFDTPYWNSNSEAGSQGLGGTIVSMSDLGIATGTTIYGYSLMAYDVTTGGNMTNLVDWTNTTYYASNTTGATGTGGIDLSAVNGVLYNRRVPEPSTYGAIFIGSMLAFIGWRRKYRSPAAAV